MRRREIILGMMGIALSPASARSQQAAKTYRIGMLDTATRELNRPNLEIFYKRLAELGYVEGRNLSTEYRSVDGRNERLPELVRELIAAAVDVIVVRGTPEVLAVKDATSTIPVVMTAVVDPVGLGVARSLSRPGGNVTGMSSLVTDLETKRIEYLKEIVPGLRRMALVGDFRNSAVRKQWEEVRTAARALGLDPRHFDIRSETDVRSAFEIASQENVQALRVGIDGTTRPNRDLIIALAAEHRLPAVYAAREFVDAGGLICYAADYGHLYWRAASFVDRILKGEKPADLPIELPSKFELIVNLRTAKALGLTIPPSILARADEVIE